MPGADGVGAGSDLVRGGVPFISTWCWLDQWVCALFQFVPSSSLCTWSVGALCLVLTWLVGTYFQLVPIVLTWLVGAFCQ